MSKFDKLRYWGRGVARDYYCLLKGKRAREEMWHRCTLFDKLSFFIAVFLFKGLLCDLLWSDPDKDVQGWGENDRGVSFTFGADVVSKFLNRHDLDLICRAHQVWNIKLWDVLIFINFTSPLFLFEETVCEAYLHNLMICLTLSHLLRGYVSKVYVFAVYCNSNKFFNAYLKLFRNTCSSFNIMFTYCR